MAERSLQIAHRNLLEIKQDSFFNIFKDRSFHCDVFNVCLDKRLEGKHSSRENSGHDERWLCLEVMTYSSH